MNKRIFVAFLALSLLFVFAVGASAIEEDLSTLPDLTQKGSLTFTMDAEGVPLDNGNLNLYYVATIERVSEQNYDFKLLDALALEGATLDTDNLNDVDQVKKLLDCAQGVFDEYLSKPIEDGEVRFADLDAGLYLVWQGSEDASEGYDAIAPFLISIPKWENDRYLFDVEADPKVPFETEPTPPTPPPPPPPPDIPQTGQLNWPVPVMAITGAVLLIVGWILCAGRKRCEREK